MFKIWFTGIRVKLLLLALIPSAALVLSVLYSQSVMMDLEESLEKANLVRAPLITYSGDMMTAAVGVARWTVSAMWHFNDKEERPKALKSAHAEIEIFEKAMSEYQKLPQNQEVRQKFVVVEQLWPESKETLLDILKDIESAKPEKQQEAEAHFIKEIRPRIAKIISAIHDSIQLQREVLAADVKKDAEETARTLAILMFGGLVSILVSLVFMVIVLKFIIKQLNAVTGNLVEASSTLSFASQELSASSTEVAAGSSQTAASIQETVSSLEELASMVKTTDESSQLSLQLSQQTQSQAQMGEKKLNDLVSSLSEISKSASKITDIIQVIDDISFQTNLLALNAAVEAARAGDQGKGFAVVAEAVRSLAQKSAVSAKEVGDLIRGSVEKTAQGVNLGSECKEIMTGMFDSLKKVSDKSEEIARSSHEQTTGMEQISKAMNQLDHACQQNTAASEQISTASNELSQQAMSLGETIVRLKVLVDGSQAGSSKMQFFDSKNAMSFTSPRKSEKPNKAQTKNDFGLNNVA